MAATARRVSFYVNEIFLGATCVYIAPFPFWPIFFWDTVDCEVEKSNIFFASIHQVPANISQ
jgi:hypothetical protein